ncbi:hypothetical protein GPECTOR_96g711 [Gonium pectorale]|uniref:Uncharacterized protein n=1 Tax=Gonium pectorale TaxID=33097 RepID=A0A150G191_GONPE|nr:hypothetical protein GPECTOR_96g711 [Gonium pectorale]|eukprot:KXZ43245.1 hypothetical protein GPECTOR_96g711 [Gonium pectorale]
MSHRPIDYSKWDNIDTDSDADDEPMPDVPPPPPPPPGRAVPPNPPPPPPDRAGPPGHPTFVIGTGHGKPGKPANAPQPGLHYREQPQPLPPTAPPPPPEPQPGEVLCTFGPCSGDRSALFFRATSLPTEHPAFLTGTPSPVAALVGLPLLVYRLDPRPSLSIPRAATYDNQRVTYIMIDPYSGFAAAEWQQGIGSVVLVRSDRKPLPPQHVEAFWMFCDHLLGLFSSGIDPNPEVEMTPAKWQSFFRKYKREYSSMKSRRAEWKDMWLPWEAPP